MVSVRELETKVTLYEVKRVSNGEHESPNVRVGICSSREKAENLVTDSENGLDHRYNIGELVVDGNEIVRRDKGAYLSSEKGDLKII